MIYLAAVSRENMEKAMLISLILILGVILYMKLIKNLKKKRLNLSFASISGYDVVEDRLEVRYSTPRALNSEFLFTNKEGSKLFSVPVIHEQGGDYTYSVPLVKFSEELVNLTFITENQKITKKIYLNI